MVCSAGELQHVHDHGLSQLNNYFVFKRLVFGLWLQWFRLHAGNGLIFVLRTSLIPSSVSHAVLDFLIEKNGEAVVGWGRQACAASGALPCEPQQNPANPRRNRLFNL